MPRQTRLTFGTGVSVPIPNNFVIPIDDAMGITESRTLNYQPGSGSTRFPGDPGIGNMYVGENLGGGAQTSNWTPGDPTYRETQWGAKVGLYRSYFNTWDSSLGTNIADRATRDLNNHRMPWISFKSDPSPASGSNWGSFATGGGDAILDDIMTRLAAVNGPVWLCHHHEPYDDVGSSGTLLEWTNGNKRMMNKRPSNVAIAPILQSSPFDPTVGGGQNIAPWYPPGSFDLAGIDTYNHKWFVPSPGGNNWRDPSVVLGFLDKMRSDLGTDATLPIGIAEYGVRTDPNTPGRAGQWLRDWVALAKTKNVPAVSYFDSNQNVNDGGTYWTLDWTGDGTDGTERLNAYGPLVKNNFHL